MKTKFEDYVLGLYSPVVQMRLEQVDEAKRHLDLLLFEGLDWREESVVGSAVYTGNDYWDEKIDDAQLELKNAKKELFKQMAKESLLPFSLVVGVALALGGMV